MYLLDRVQHVDGRWNVRRRSGGSLDPLYHALIPPPPELPVPAWGSPLSAAILDYAVLGSVTHLCIPVQY